QVPGFGVSGQLIAGVGITSALAFMWLIWFAVRARNRPVTTGVEELVGHQAIALDYYTGRGLVRIRGEIWQAESTEPVTAGQKLQVLALEGLVLHVAPLVPAPAGRIQEPGVRS